MPIPDSTAERTSLPFSPARLDTASFSRSTITRVSSGTKRLVNSSKYCGSGPDTLLWLSTSYQKKLQKHLDCEDEKYYTESKQVNYSEKGKKQFKTHSVNLGLNNLKINVFLNPLLK